MIISLKIGGILKEYYIVDTYSVALKLQSALVEVLSNLLNSLESTTRQFDQERSKLVTMQQQVAAERQREQVQTRGSSSRLHGSQTVSSARLDSLQSKKIEVQYLHYSETTNCCVHVYTHIIALAASSERRRPENDELAAVSQRFRAALPRRGVGHSFAVYGGDWPLVQAAALRLSRRLVSEICRLDALRSSALRFCFCCFAYWFSLFRCSHCLQYSSKAAINVLSYPFLFFISQVGEVRLHCLATLTPLFDFDSSTEPIATGRMELFTQRFRDRLVEMVQDKDIQVAVSAVKLLCTIARYIQLILYSAYYFIMYK